MGWSRRALCTPGASSKLVQEALVLACRLQFHLDPFADLAGSSRLDTEGWQRVECAEHKFRFLGGHVGTLNTLNLLALTRGIHQGNAVLLGTDEVPLVQAHKYGLAERPNLLAQCNVCA